MIAREAGIAQGLLYNYFAGKEDVLRALLEQSMDDMRQSFEAADEAASGHGLEAIIRASFRIVRHHFDCWRLS